MPLSQTYVRNVEQALATHSPSLVEALRHSLERLPAGVPDERVRLWLDEAVALADHSLRSWEACAEYLAAGPRLMTDLDEAGFRQWAACGRDLADLAAAIAAAYFRASPDVVPLLAGSQVREWAVLGSRLYKATWKSISLSSEFFAVSELLLRKLSLPDLGRFIRVLEGISDRSADLAAACLDAAPHVVDSLEYAERIAFLDFAAAISDSAWPEASLYFQRGPELLRPIDPAERARYLELATRVARRLGRQAYNLFAEGSLALKDVDQAYHARLIELANMLVGTSPVAAMSFIKSAPALAQRLRLPELETWHRAGLEILQQTAEGGEAYFRLESGKAEQMIHSLSARVELSQVGELLRLYGKALTGVNISVQPVSALEQKGIGWVSERGPSTEGSAVFLPEYVEHFDTKEENFGVFKVYATHQTAHIEFGSFDFSFRRPGNLTPNTRFEVEAARREEGLVTKSSWTTDMERFFDLFPLRQMGADIFTVVEDLRIDSRINQEYAGIRRASRQLQQRELAFRPEIKTLPLQQAFIEDLVRASLDGENTITFPKPLEHLVLTALQTIHLVKDPAATVEDSAEVTLSLYRLAEAIPNIPPEMLQDLDWEELTDTMLEQLESQLERMQDQDPTAGLEELPDSAEMPYQSPEQVSFRGDFKPEMVQLLMRMRQQQMQPMDEEELSGLTPEQIKELLEKSVEVDMNLDDEFDMSAFNAFLENLQQEAGTSLDQDLPDDAPVVEQPGSGDGAGQGEVKTFYYDEWDFRAADYKPRWCTVRERRIEEGSEEYYQKVLRDHAGLVGETQRQFELLKPETFRKIKRLEDGEDIDLDAALDFLVTKKSGHGETPKIYWRRNKVERDVAVAFLLDMSASTDEEVDRKRPRRDAAAGDGQADYSPSDPRRFYQAGGIGRGGVIEPPKRIIDLEKESLVLLTRALEVIGDRYGIYGFSGYGRENVEYYVIKDFDEQFGEDICRRIDKVTPIRSTRMGPAIRHTVTKLDATDARAKILFLVSDGRPQDHGYGRDRTEKEYAIHDTHKALVEARHKGIVPFALTVDKEGHDYLGQMCGDMAYEVLGDIELLPSRLPTLYRRLTE